MLNWAPLTLMLREMHAQSIEYQYVSVLLPLQLEKMYFNASLLQQHTFLVRFLNAKDFANEVWHQWNETEAADHRVSWALLTISSLLSEVRKEFRILRLQKEMNFDQICLMNFVKKMIWDSSITTMIHNEELANHIRLKSFCFTNLRTWNYFSTKLHGELIFNMHLR